VYMIQVSNPDHTASHVRQILLDGQPVEGGIIPLVDDQMDHRVLVTLGSGTKIQKVII
jgi:hypothetical protein